MEPHIVLRICGKEEGSREDTCAEQEFEDEQSMENGTYQGMGDNICAYPFGELYRGGWETYCLKRLVFGENAVAGATSRTSQRAQGGKSKELYIASKQNQTSDSHSPFSSED